MTRPHEFHVPTTMKNLLDHLRVVHRVGGLSDKAAKDVIDMHVKMHDAMDASFKVEYEHVFTAKRPADESSEVTNRTEGTT